MKTLGLTMAFLSGILGVLLLVAAFGKVKYSIPALYSFAAAGFLVGAFIFLLLVTILGHVDKLKTDDKVNG